MTDQRPVRYVDAFYEFEGSHAVPKARAEGLYTAALEIVSRYTGPVVLTGLRPARIRLPEDAYIDPDKVKLGKAPHTALLTGRGTSAGSAGSSRFGGATAVDFKLGGSEGSNVVATVAPPHLDQTDTLSLGWLVHEFGHSFALRHCAGALCMMTASQHLEINTNSPPIATGRPFCDDCVGELELAGYQNIAAQLPAASPAAPQQDPATR